MKVLIQRVKSAAVKIDGVLYSAINKGLLLLVCIEKGDTAEDLLWSSKKIVSLRIFEDESGKMNRSIREEGGELLVVSQFTLVGSCKKGTRPSFDKAQLPELANGMYEKFVSLLRSENISVKTGIFGAMMDLELINHGPVTLMLEHSST